MKRHHDVAAYIWPSYHHEPRVAHFWPEKDGEWHTVRRGTPRFPGHDMPRIPLLGYQNEADPKVMRQHVERALDYLCSRPDVDPARVGCGGLSGGGLRTVFLAGLNPRIKAAFPVGWMTTWRDVMLYKSHTRTWMLYVPGLPRQLDYPEILGRRAPLPAFVLNDEADPLFTLGERQDAGQIPGEVYTKAGAPENYCCKFYSGPHKFDRETQEDAFVWLDGILKQGKSEAP